MDFMGSLSKRQFKADMHDCTRIHGQAVATCGAKLDLAGGFGRRFVESMSQSMHQTQDLTFTGGANSTSSNTSPWIPALRASVV